jgi:GntR family transcriptional regulator
VFNRRHPLPLYYQLKELIREQVENGEIRAGDRIPSERELSERYEISRMTARQAITELVNEGLLFREQGKGTFVAMPKISQGLIGLTSYTEDMLRRGLQPGTKLLCLEIVPPTRKIADRLHISLDSKVIQIQRLRLANDEPMALETSHIPASLCPDLAQQDLEGQSLYKLMEDRYALHLANASQTLEPANASTVEAELLNVSPTVPLLLIERITYTTDGTPAEFVKSLYRGDRYKFYVELQR